MKRFIRKLFLKPDYAMTWHVVSCVQWNCFTNLFVCTYANACSYYFMQCSFTANVNITSNISEFIMSCIITPSCLSSCPFLNCCLRGRVENTDSREISFRRENLNHARGICLSCPSVLYFRVTNSLNASVQSRSLNDRNMRLQSRVRDLKGLPEG